MGDEAIKQSIEDEKARDGDGDGSGDGEGEGEDETIRSGDDNSTRVEGALLAGGSQHMCQTQRMRNNTLPVSSRPRTKYPECPYGVCRRRRR